MEKTNNFYQIICPSLKTKLRYNTVHSYAYLSHALQRKR